MGYFIWQSPDTPTGLIADINVQAKNTVNNLAAPDTNATEVFSSMETPLFVPPKITDLVGQSVFSKFVQAQKAGVTIDDATVDTISDQILNDISQNNKIKPKVFSASDLHTISNPTRSDWQTLADSLTDIRNKYENEFGSILDPSGGNGLTGASDPRMPIVLSQSGEVYQKLATDLSKLSVPAAAAKPFLDLLNSYAQSAAGLSEFKYFSSDPLRALVGIKAHQDGRQNEALALQSLQSIFLANGIISSVQTP